MGHLKAMISIFQANSSQFLSICRDGITSWELPDVANEVQHEYKERLDPR
jgi:hypothetical protein